MEKKDFIISAEDKNKLSNGGKLFHYGFGLCLLLTGIICYIKALEHKNGLQFLCFVFIGAGVMWIIKGALGKAFFIMPKRYFKIGDHKIVIKSPNKKEVIYPAGVIKEIKLSAVQMDIGLEDCVKSYNVKWITYQEYQELKIKLNLFCKENQIGFDY